MNYEFGLIEEATTHVSLSEEFAETERMNYLPLTSEIVPIDATNHKTQVSLIDTYLQTKTIKTQKNEKVMS